MGCSTMGEAGNCWKCLWDVLRDDRALWGDAGLQFPRSTPVSGVAAFSPGNRMLRLRSAQSAAASRPVRTLLQLRVECYV